MKGVDGFALEIVALDEIIGLQHRTVLIGSPEVMVFLGDVLIQI
jgi:hypothetical protein